jgi:outer membrane receptor protein involved in Fe transport
VPVRPARFPAALAGLTLAVVLTGCAGTDSAASADGGSSPTASSTASTSAAPTSGAPTTRAGQRIEVTVAGGDVGGDTGRVPVAVGEQVTLVITSDAADEVHVHGYDLTADLTPGTPAELTFAATIPGVFEVELHEAGTVLLSLQVG